MDPEARIAELEAEVAALKAEAANTSQGHVIDSLKATIKLYAEENQRLLGNERSVSGTKKAPSGPPRNTSIHNARAEINHLQAQIDDLDRSNKALQQAVHNKDKQIHAANAAANWAQQQVSSLVTQLHALAADVERISGPGPKSSRRTKSPASRYSRVEGESGNKAMADLCCAVSAAEAATTRLAKRVACLKEQERVKELENTAKQWQAVAERQRTDIQQLEQENTQLREQQQNAAAATEAANGARTIVSAPEVIKMPSHTTHDINADHWPVRSVGCQTPKLPEENGWVYNSGPSLGSPPYVGRNSKTASWESPKSMSNTWYTHGDSPSRPRATSPGRSGSSGLISSAVLKRHMMTKSPFRRAATAAAS
eukprot:Sspe_Gene.81689::Locus_52696_Transcript_2_2_Confidence_0.800_Length_1246::g.81689::m.81689